MSFASKVLYTGDGVTKSFTVPMPYISKTHINVYVNQVLQLNTMHYTWSGPSTILFADAPGLNDAIEIKRWTSPTNTLVDFTDGSTLRADDLDTAYLHNYYLSQEYSDSFNELINNAILLIASGNGIVETEPDAVIAALVNEMLSDSAAATLQQRVSDIDTNAEAIITLGESLQVQINTLAEAAAATVFVQANEPVPGVGGVPDPIPEGARWYDTDDNNAPYIYQSSAWVPISDPRIGNALADIDVLNVQMAENNAAILDERFVRATEVSALAQRLGLIGVDNGDQSAFILNLDTVNVESGLTLASKFSLLETADANNAASITAEQTARISGDNANASDITALDSRLTTAEGNLVTNSSAISVLQTDVGTNTTDIAGNTVDISANSTAITALQSTIDLRNRTFAAPNAPTAENVGDLWIDTDDNKLYRWNGTIWVNVQDAAISGNASAITGLDTRVTSAEGTISSHASSITTLQSSVTTLDGEMNTAQVDIVANTNAIVTAEGDINALEARYGVDLSVNGYVTGFRQNNDGTTGSFVILADKFAVVDPSGDPGEPQYVPFLISGGKVTFNSNVEINGNLILNGSVVGAALANGTVGSTQIGTNAISTTHISANAVTANEIAANAVTAGKINVTNLEAVKTNTGSLTVDGTLTVGTAGKMISSGTGFESGAGFFLGYDSTAYKFYVGNYAAGDYLSWDGTTLTVRGDLSIGTYTASTTDILLAANTERSTSSLSWVEVKKFKINKPGTVRCYTDYRVTSTSGGSTGHNSEWRWKLDGVIKDSWAGFSATWATTNFSLTTTETSQYITLEYTSGERNPVEPVACGARVRNTQIKAVIDFGESVITD